MPFSSIADLPPSDEWDIEFFAEPHRDYVDSRLSGDYCAAELQTDGSVLILLLDVMGHGEAAAELTQRIEQIYLADERAGNLPPDVLLDRLHS
ncbi:MAG: hypothetical protein KDA66_20400, partial [Planctomycetaceae bacterium]|nr:hypothetical protein [Planctomycetaceae bacterium]